MTYQDVLTAAETCRKRADRELKLAARTLSHIAQRTHMARAAKEQRNAIYWTNRAANWR